jgi:hypothetical protein
LFGIWSTNGNQGSDGRRKQLCIGNVGGQRGNAGIAAHQADVAHEIGLGLGGLGFGQGLQKGFFDQAFVFCFFGIMREQGNCITWGNTAGLATGLNLLGDEVDAFFASTDQFSKAALGFRIAGTGQSGQDVGNFGLGAALILGREGVEIAEKKDEDGKCS